MINVESLKNDFRKSSVFELSRISKLVKFNKSKIVVKELEKTIKELDAKKILIYIPLENEVDVTSLINQLRREKKEVYVPYMEGKSFKAVKYRLPLKKGKFGIKETKNSIFKARKIDLAIVPIIGVDKFYKRIGFGKGMYDRFFYSLSYRPTIVFTQLKLCKSNLILTNHYDIQADYIISS